VSVPSRLSEMLAGMDAATLDLPINPGTLESGASSNLAADQAASASPALWKETPLSRNYPQTRVYVVPKALPHREGRPVGATSEAGLLRQVGRLPARTFEQRVIGRATDCAA
jgi:hypothetical protein